jgi:hypothetical protein
MSVKPSHYLIHIEQRINAPDLRAPDHHDRNLQRPRGLDLGVGGPSATVLGNDDLNAFLPHQLRLITSEEGPSRQDKPVPGQGHNVGRPINGANDIAVLWRGCKRGELQTAMGQKSAARHLTERSDGGFGIISGNPPVAVLLFPGGPGERHKRNAGALAGADRILRNAYSEWMRGIDDCLNMLREEKIVEPVDPAKTTDAERNRRLSGVFGTARERQYGGDVIALRQTPRQQARLSGASEDKNAHLVAPRAPRR